MTEEEKAIKKILWDYLTDCLAVHHQVKNRKIHDIPKAQDKAFLAIQSLKQPRLSGETRIICMCGSSKFVRQMACIGWALERDKGVIVLGLHLLPANYPNVTPDHMAETEGKKEHMDNLHKRKIDLADEVLIINIDGYIGESTRSEIEYAKKLNKPISYLEPKP